MSQIQRSQSGFAPINGAKLYYEVAGQGPSLLLMHAGVADSRMWDEQVAALAQHCQTIRYDLRGFGQSLLPRGTFAHYEDVAGLLDFLGVEKVAVRGASFGGSVALDFALAYPARVEALVLSAPAVSGYELTSTELLRFVAEEEAALERGDFDAATELNLRMWVDGPQRQPGQVRPAVRERVRVMQRQAFANPVPAGVALQSLEPPALTRLAEIQAPTLVMVGDLDVPEFIELAGLVRAGISGAEKVVIAGTAHLPSLEQPELFNRVVLDFLGKKGLVL
ncbi:MAG: alpha/beta fold hydrolase [Anaerolineae bacterium]